MTWSWRDVWAKPEPQWEAPRIRADECAVVFAKPDQVVEVEKIVYVDRLVSGREYIEHLWRHALAQVDWARAQGRTGIDMSIAWKQIANDAYVMLCAPWFEEGSEINRGKIGGNHE